MTSSVPQFTADRLLGTGASSRVQCARLEQPWAGLPSGTELALKRPREDRAGDPQVEAAFARERRALEVVSSEHVVGLLAHGKDEQGPWLLQERLPGLSLREELRSGPLSEERVRAIGRDLADGLAALHAANWCHGDIKPENVRLDSTDRAVWLDLGLAREIGGPDIGGGNLAYLSPEEARGAARTRESEVFSLGVLLFELATGTHPLANLALTASRVGSGQREEDQQDELLFALAEPRLPLVSDLRPELSPFLDQLLASLLTLHPAERPSAPAVRETFETGEEGWWWFERQRSTPRSSSGAPEWALVGRDDELAVLGEAFTAGVEGSAGVLCVEGETGVGKTRLLRESMPRLRMSRPEEPPLVLTASCAAWEVERPGQPIRSLLRQWLGLPRDREPGPGERGRLQELLPPTAAATLEDALSTGGPTETEMAVPAALAEWWLALGKREPLVVVLDDFHSAGEVTLDIVQRVAEGLHQTRGLLVTVVRAHSVPRHPRLLERCTERFQGPDRARPAPRLCVPPLDQVEVGRLIESLFHHTSPRLRLGRVFFERSEGNPGQLVELLRTMTHRGLLRREDPRSPYHLDGAPEDVPRARTLATAIAASFRALPREDQRWLARLAVVGGTIEPVFLERAFAPGRPAEVERLLGRLVRLGWLVVAGRRFRFARQALREAVLRALGPDRRRRLHRVAAEALRPEEDGPLRLSTAYQRAYHLRSAGRREELLEFLPELVRLALERGHPQRVHTLCSWGLDALDRSEASPRASILRIELLEAAADSADRLGRREAQRGWLDHLSDVDLDPEQDPVGAGRIYLLHARHAAGIGRYGLARGLFLNASELFLRGKARDLESESLRRLAHIQSHIGELEAAGTMARRSFDVGIAPQEKALAAVAISLVELLEDRYESALRHVDRARKLVRGRAGVRARGPLAAASLMRARIYRVVGRPGRALAAVQHAARLARQAGERRLEIEALARLGALWIDVDREGEAETRLRDALFSAREIEDGRSEALASLWLGTLLSENEVPEGAHLIERSATLARRLGLGRVTALSTALLARVALARGVPQLGLQRSREAMEGLERHGAELPDRIVIVATHALCMRRCSHETEAREAESRLARTVRRTNERIQNTILRKEQLEAAGRALAAASTEIGHLVPRSLSDTGIFEAP